MEVLFTPWRYPYLTSPKSENAEGCIFCKAAQSKRTRDTLTLGWEERTHVLGRRRTDCGVEFGMALPRGTALCAGDLFILEQERVLVSIVDASLRALIRLTAESQRILSDVYQPDGFNVGMNFGRVAGAGVADHYHLHVVPRWSGDSNFMTVTARTRVVPEDLDVTFDKLQPHFKKLRKDFAGS